MESEGLKRVLSEQARCKVGRARGRAARALWSGLFLQIFEIQVQIDGQSAQYIN